VTGRSFHPVEVAAETTQMEVSSRDLRPAPPQIAGDTFCRETAASDIPSEWYAVQTRPRHEKRVAAEVRARDMEEFLPVHRSRNRWKNGIVAEVELPLFPCYLFVRVPLCDRLRLLGLPGVIGFAVTSAHPTALPQKDIEALRALSLICRAEPHPFLKVGDRVRLVAGPLTGMEGILTRRKQELRVVLSLDFILRSVAVEVSEFDIEPIATRTKRSPTLVPSYPR